MTGETFFVRTPWDARAFGFDTYELTDASPAALAAVEGVRGHFTARVDPLASKALLHRSGFYYCDTLIEPHCSAGSFRDHRHASVSIAPAAGFEQVRAFADGAFLNGRFHRDFNVGRRLADARYSAWLKELCDAGKCFGLLHEGDPAGFLCHEAGSLVLHALAERYRGRGLAKCIWSAVCRELFAQGQEELRSSISASNMPALNLYASLGFRFRNPKDIYHRFNP